MTSWFSRLFVTSGLFLMASGCSPTSDWKHLTYEQMLSKFDIVVVGTDVRHVDSSSVDFDKDSEFEVSCVLKSDGKVIFENILIVGVYPENSCLLTVMYPGGDFIVGLTRTASGHYIRHDVNPGQLLAFANSTANLNRAFQMCDFQSPMLPAGHVGAPPPFCQAKNNVTCTPSGAGREGVSAAVLLVTFVTTLWLKMI